MIFKNLLFLSLSIFLFSCNDIKPFKTVFTSDKDKLVIGQDLDLKIISLEDKEIDSVIFFLQDNTYASTNANIKIPLKDIKLGKHSVKMKIFTEEESFEMKDVINILNNKPPKIYTYEIVESYLHDINAYTQGLEFYQDTLYESAGHYGKSTLRKVDYASGEVLSKHLLPEKYFAEGITIVDGKIYQLTWQEGEGLVYDVQSFKVKDKFKYNNSKEGWGLCHDESYFYKSDGTNKIWKLDKTTLEELDYIQPTTHQSISQKLNELEYVNGKIYANTYGKDGVAIINPKNGAIEGVIDFRNLRKQVKQHPDLDVLNGIAYHKEKQTLFVTGKNWNKLFEVKVISK